MKQLLISILIFNIHFAFSQKVDESTILWKQRFKEEQDSLYRASNKANFKEQFFKIDTLFKSEDSIVLDYYSKNDKIIRRDFLHMFQNKQSLVKQVIDSVVFFYNTNEQLEFIEFWQPLLVYDRPESGMVEYSKELFLLTYQRIKYDLKQRIVLNVIKGATRSCRYSTTYNEKGNLQSVKEKKIADYEFWDK